MDLIVIRCSNSSTEYRILHTKLYSARIWHRWAGLASVIYIYMCMCVCVCVCVFLYILLLESFLYLFSNCFNHTHTRARAPPHIYIYIYIYIYMYVFLLLNGNITLYYLILGKWLLTTITSLTCILSFW